MSGSRLRFRGMLRAVASLATGRRDTRGDVRMWCKTCQQDTPGIAHAATGRIVCSRCQQPVRARKATANARICDDGIALDEQSSAPAAAAPTFAKDDWSNQQRVRTLARELKRPTFAASKTSTSVFADRRRFEPPHDFFGQLERQQIASQTLASEAPNAAQSEGSQIVGWLVVVIGSLAFAGGASLIAWCLSSKNMTHWNLGLGLALGGQGTLIMGLVLVASRLWRYSRYAANKLHDVHIRLGQVQQTAEILTTMRSGTSAPAFYAELARGANPHAMLANLKGQLDQLATRLGSGV
jgi:hypothetical protein